MAANKFATMVYRITTSKVAVILVYTLLEWLLLFLLFLNAFFSYLISKFVSYFGLKHPCLLCSRVDHLFDNDPRPCRDLVCDDHVAEIKKFSNGGGQDGASHRRRVSGGRGMCEDCSSPRPALPLGADHHRTVTLLSLVKGEMDGEELRCSCCSVVLESGFNSGDLVVKERSLVVTDGIQLGNSAQDDYDDDDRGEEEVDEAPEEEEGLERGVEKEEMKARKEEEEGLGELGRKPAEQEHIPLDALLLYQSSELSKRVHGADVCFKIIHHFEDQLFGAETIHKTKQESQSSDESQAKNGEFAKSGEEVSGSFSGKKASLKESKGLNSTHEIKGKSFSHLRRPPPLEIPQRAWDYSSVIHGNRFKEDLCQQQIASLEGFQTASLDSVVEIEDRGKTGDCAFGSKEDQCQQRIASPEGSHKLSQRKIVRIEDGASFQMVDGGADYSLVTPIDVSIEDPISKESIVEIKDEASSSVPELMDKTGDCSLAIPANELDDGLHEQDIFRSEVAEKISQDSIVEREPVLLEENREEIQGSEGDSKTDGDANCEVSIGSEICEQEEIDDSQHPETISHLVCEHISPTKIITETRHEAQATKIEHLDKMHQVVNHHLPVIPENNELEEEGALEIPACEDDIHNLDNQFQFDRGEFWPGPVDENFAGDSSEILTVDQLKAALKAERRALTSLYAELEEERLASAISAHQTMSMITRLQEEKAAVEMEAMQYQRMMEEQSEYDQEALQFLNELVMKREKEKKELEKELEVYCEKVILLEAKEQRRMKRDNHMTDASSASHSTDESEGEENFNGLNEDHNSPIMDVLSSGKEQETAKHLSILNESLADFEKERICILEKLRTLEEKLFALDGGERSTENVESIEKNDHGFDSSDLPLNDEVDDLHNDCFEDQFTDGNHSSKRPMSSGLKNTLPLSDEEKENEDGPLGEQELADVSQDSDSQLASERKRLAIAEEMDSVCERLKALETDRVLLNHCILTLKKGDEGMDILLNILRHLRNVRNMELRIMNEVA